MKGPEPPGRGRMSRRSFLQAAGFTLATVVAGCSRPPARPRVVDPHPSTLAAPGARLEYATTCPGCSAGCGVLASVRDGRPVKLEGMPGHPVSRGGLCAVGQASILGLYDDKRLDRPAIDGTPVDWGVVDARLRAALAAADGPVRILTSTDAAASPTTARTIARFLGRFGDGRHDVVDVLSASAMAQSHEATHGLRAIPHLRLDRAKLVVGVDADFLGTWISPVEFARQYAANRPEHHVQVESILTVTGTCADRRIVVSPDMMRGVVAGLYRHLLGQAEDAAPGAAPPAAPDLAGLPDLARRMWAARGSAVVICGSGDPAVQRLANLINVLLGAYGEILDLARPSRQRLGDDRSLDVLRNELADGRVAALVVAGTNPVHALPDGAQWRRWLQRVPVLVSVTERADETSVLARFVCPPPHPLETWGDYEPVAGVLGIRQPLMVARGATRSLDESLAAWSGEPADARQIVRTRWHEEVYDPAKDGPSFEAFWDRCVRDGWAHRPSRETTTPAARADAGPADAGPGADDRPPGTLTLVAYPAVALLDGRHGYNPWLLELPDPVTKTTWDSYATVSPGTARALGVVDGEVVRISADGPAGLNQVEVPIVVQAGQHDGVVAVPLGYGQMASARFAGLAGSGATRPGSDLPLVGANVAPLLSGATSVPGAPAVRVVATGRRTALARSQAPAWLEEREAGGWGTDSAGVVVRRAGAADAGSATGPGESGDLWASVHAYEGPRWGMVIDLDACTGCGACVVACQAENNTPVVGRAEMARQRGMHWLRVDHYLLGEEADPVVVHQPMTCHHCGRAPCETVCPVLATTHSSDGLNQQVYSRCVGTRYCMNNCPFKVRRFNWFEYPRNGESLNPALNPEVTVRSRGVAEKCTFCVQRIQEARLVARGEDRSVRDGEVIPACAQTCPSSAITFGDLNDPDSRVSRRLSSPRTFSLFADMRLQPAVHYQSIVSRGRQDHGDGA